MAKSGKYKAMKIVRKTNSEHMVSIFCMWLEELENERIITPMQRSQCREYLTNGLLNTAKDKKS
jgi:hypothetical protein